MSKYDILLKILDQIRAEGIAAGFKSYNASAEDIEWLNQTRSKAYIHLYLKVKFGLLSFAKSRDVCY
jgi:hypothetical protein